MEHVVRLAIRLAMFFPARGHVVKQLCHAFSRARRVVVHFESWRACTQKARDRSSSTE